MTTEQDLQAVVAEKCEELDIPGVAVGVLMDGEEHHAYHGVTSIENALPVEAGTLFQFGSTGKTYTATAVMRLVERGDVSLDAPVKQYLPEFKLADADVAEKVTVLHLLNHSAGWEGDLMDDTGDGDDAIAKYVERMATIKQVTPLGSAVSYNNASLSVAGMIIARITNQTYEAAIKELLLDPLGMDMTFFFNKDIMTRRFVAGHNQEDDGTIKIARPWSLPRGNSPAGGMSSNSHDMLTWARFHLGDGRAQDGTQVLSQELLDLMKQPTMEMKGSALGDYVGISWLMRDVDGVRIVGHGGDTNGHHSAFEMVPEKRFAVSTLTNCGPNGGQFNEEIVKWALEAYAGVVDKDPEPVMLDDAALARYVGQYETIAAEVALTPKDGQLAIMIKMKPEMIKVLREQGEEGQTEQGPWLLGILPGDGDRYIVTDGPAKGMKGYFTRSASGDIGGVHVGGRLATRVP
jgi:CubicO group peptidase (beta-lactamase class C family)